MLKKLFSYFPVLEVVTRKIYKNSSDNSTLKRLAFKLYRTEKKEMIDPVPLSQLINDLLQLGIQQGDIVIVHSSLKGMESISATPRQIIEALIELLGPDGTLVMPAFPYYKQEKEGEAVLKYNPKKTLAWTGILPNVFLTVDGTVRSRYPNNSLAANGKYARDMFENEMKDNRSHGEHSAWNFCAEHHAKVVFLGVKPDHALSEIHLGEDILKDNWPINNWCYIQRYLIKENDTWLEKSCEVRRGFWSQYLTEEYCIRRLRKAGILKISDGLCRGYISDMYTFKKWLIKEIEKNKLLFYRIPKKHWKRESPYNEETT